MAQTRTPQELAPNYPIRPEHIDLGGYAIGGPGVMPREEPVARLIIDFCQQRKQGWASFTEAELLDFDEEREEKSLPIHQLMRALTGKRLIDVIEHPGTTRDEKTGEDNPSVEYEYIVRHRFVAGCFLNSPVRPRPIAEAPREEEPAK